MVEVKSNDFFLPICSCFVRIYFLFRSSTYLYISFRCLFFCLIIFFPLCILPRYFCFCFILSTLPIFLFLWSTCQHRILSHSVVRIGANFCQCSHHFGGKIYPVWFFVTPPPPPPLPIFTLFIHTQSKAKFFQEHFFVSFCSKTRAPLNLKNDEIIDSALIENVPLLILIDFNELVVLWYL